MIDLEVLGLCRRHPHIQTKTLYLRTVSCRVLYDPLTSAMASFLYPVSSTSLMTMISSPTCRGCSKLCALPPFSTCTHPKTIMLLAIMLQLQFACTLGPDLGLIFHPVSEKERNDRVNYQGLLCSHPVPD